MIDGKIRFRLNGEEAVFTGAPSARLLDVLRDELRLTGTKCGCKEGECGACAVIIDGRLMNSCLVAMGRLGGSDVVTIEGYSKTERFAVLDKAYESVSAVQCGFCIPGMMMASECLLASNPCPTEEEIRVGISGNLCRCTGYNPIVKAVGIAAGGLGSLPPVEASGGRDCCCGGGEGHLDLGPYAPGSLQEALLLRKDLGLIPHAGGTDLMVEAKEGAKYLFLHRVPEMRRIAEDEEYIRFGAACTFTEAMEHLLTPGILKEACRQVAAPAIRNAGTLGGNIGNGSPKADSALVFMATDSRLRLASAGGERILPVKDFYQGRKKLALAADELIVEILMPKNGIGNFYFKKVGARDALAISRVSFAGVLDVKDGVVRNCATAFGAVSDVILRLGEIDAMLIGKTIEEAKGLKQAYLDAYDKAIVPIRGRVGVEYRKDVCMNLLRDFLEVNGI